MATYKISKSFEWKGHISGKAASVMTMFGLTSDRLSEKSVIHNCQLEIDSGDVVYITGPSGSGKSVLLRELEKAVSACEKMSLSEIEFPKGQAVIDCIDGDFLASLKVLSTAGLNDCLCVLNQASHLSDGQKYRLRLAMALGSGKKFIFADEFCSHLDRITAAVISYNVRKFANQTGVTFVLASSHDDIVADLAPDVLVVKELSGPAEVVYKNSV